MIASPLILKSAKATASLSIHENHMPKIQFTSHLKRHLDCPSTTVGGSTLRESLEEVFAENPQLRTYILDDQQAVRKHVMLFLNGEPVSDRIHLNDPVTENCEIYIMQALSGG